jgi:hypothetical protein
VLRVDQYRFCVLKNIVIASTTALYSLGISASGGVHDHGAAELFLSAEGKTLQIRLNLPAMSVVGFETIAITDAQREAVNDAQTTLHDPSQLFSLQGKACELILAEVDVASVLEAGNTPSKPSVHAASDNHHYDHDDHDDHDASANVHSDISALYEYQCETDAAITRMSFGSNGLPFGLERIKVLWVTNQGQGAGEVTPQKPGLSF